MQSKARGFGNYLPITCGRIRIFVSEIFHFLSDIESKSLNFASQEVESPLWLAVEQLVSLLGIRLYYLSSGTRVGSKAAG